jgi:hypothetical protein
MQSEFGWEKEFSLYYFNLQAALDQQAKDILMPD